MPIQPGGLQLLRLSVSMPILALLLSGCRIASSDGYRYATVDANTIGEPAVIMDRVITSAYRSEPPALQHTRVPMMRIPNPNAPVEPVQAPPAEYTGSTPLLDLTTVSAEVVVESESERDASGRSRAWLFQ